MRSAKPQPHCVDVGVGVERPPAPGRQRPEPRVTDGRVAEVDYAPGVMVAAVGARVLVETCCAVQVEDGKRRALQARSATGATMLRVFLAWFVDDP